MSKPKTKKFTLEIDAKLYEEFVVFAEKNGQSQRQVLEQALTYYLRNAVLSQRIVRPEVMGASRQSDDQYGGLYQKLTGEK